MKTYRLEIWVEIESIPYVVTIDLRDNHDELSTPDIIIHKEGKPYMPDKLVITKQ